MTAASTERADQDALLAALAPPLLLYLAWLAGSGSGVISALTVVLLAGLAMLLAREVFAGRWLVPAVLACLVVVAAGSPTGDWDARSIWLFHAKRIYTEHSLVAQLDGYASWSHNDYPVMVPAVSASLALLLGHWNELVPKLAGPLLMAPALVVLARRLPLQAITAWLVLLFFCAGPLLVNGYMDAVLAVYLVAAFALTLEAFGLADVGGATEPAINGRALLATCILFAVLTLLKNEAVFALAAVVGSATLLRLRRGGRLDRHTIGGLALALVPIIHWKWLAVTHGIGNHLTSSSLGSQALARAQDFQAPVLIAKSMLFSWPMPLSILLFAVAAWRLPSRPSLVAALLAAGGYSAVIFAAYLSTPADLRWHLDTSVDRTMLPAGLLLGYAAIAQLLGDRGHWRSLGRERPAAD